MLPQRPPGTRRDATHSALAPPDGTSPSASSIPRPWKSLCCSICRLKRSSEPVGSTLPSYRRGRIETLAATSVLIATGRRKRGGTSSDADTRRSFSKRCGHPKDARVGAYGRLTNTTVDAGIEVPSECYLMRSIEFTEKDVKRSVLHSSDGTIMREKDIPQCCCPSRRHSSRRLAADDTHDSTTRVGLPTQ